VKKFLLSRSAEEDLDEIWVRVARDSVETARASDTILSRTTSSSTVPEGDAVSRSFG
jgi:plasmid stabilization system protein ParE